MPMRDTQRRIPQLLHRGVWLFQALRRCIWFFTEPHAVGVHGIPFTPEGKIVLVTLSYAQGWRLPGGGQNAKEESQAAMLRELREEIGLTAYDTIELVTGFRHRPDYRRGESTLFVIKGVRYRPKWSLEVTKVNEFYPDALPPDTANITHRLLSLAQVAS